MAITARKIATKANIAVGLIHNYFKTIGELKAIALINVTNQLIEYQQRNSNNKSTLDKIINAANPLSGNEGTMLRKNWNEALFLSERDKDIKQAYLRSANEWHNYLINLIDEAITNNLIATTNSSDLAWHLIALCCGLDDLLVITEFDKSVIYSHIIALLNVK